MSVQSLIAVGSQTIIVDIECRLSNNLPNIIIVGSVNKAVDEARERIRGAFASSHIMLPRKRITVNLAPADIPKADSGFDLAIAVAILQADGQLTAVPDKQQAFIGELGLEGSVRPVRGIIGKLLAGRARGLTTFYIPAANLVQARLVPHITIFPVTALKDIYGHLALALPLSPVHTGAGYYEPAAGHAGGEVHLSDIAGQEQAKRALIIAAAGGHNLLFSGPPGTGKTMLARALSGILPPLDHEEALEVTQLYSLTGHYSRIIKKRPFRTPHHSISQVALSGGGQPLRPGEISLAHRGVLFLDELPEFSRAALETLRQPLEDCSISVARAQGAVDFPADFILVATANPCPCGYYGTAESFGRTCRCSMYQVLNYQKRLSGPILDRIDLYTEVHEVQHAKLLAKNVGATAGTEPHRQIKHARRRQAERFGQSGKLNGGMTNAELKRHARLERAATEFINQAAQRLKLSARAYMRTVKVARTIADLDNSAVTTVSHISEAIAYRRPMGGTD